jgi:hypothetical protein
VLNPAANAVGENEAVLGELVPTKLLPGDPPEYHPGAGIAIPSNAFAHFSSIPKIIAYGRYFSNKSGVRFCMRYRSAVSR